MDILNGIINVIVYSIVGIILAVLVNKLSLLLFDIKLSEEIKSGNKAAGIFALGLLLMLGLVIGLLNH